MVRVRIFSFFVMDATEFVALDRRDKAAFAIDELALDSLPVLPLLGA